MTLNRDKDDNFICSVCSLNQKRDLGFVLTSHAKKVTVPHACQLYKSTLMEVSTFILDIYLIKSKANLLFYFIFFSIIVVCQTKPSLHREYRYIICNVDIKEPKEHFKSQHFNYNVHIEKVGEKRKIGTPTYDALFYDRDKDFKRIRTKPLMRALGLDLINIDLKHNQNSFRTSALINEKTSRLLKLLPQSTEISFNASMTFPNNESQHPETFTVCNLQKNIKNSNFPCINDILGPYVELNDASFDQ